MAFVKGTAMTLSWNEPLASAASIAMVIFSVAILISIIRLARGPALPDRVVALDLAATLLVGTFVTFGISAEKEEMVRVATVLALINFLGTVGFAVFSCQRTDL